LLLGYKPVQHVTVLNTAGNCNTTVLQYYGTTVLYAVRRWPKRRYAAHDCIQCRIVFVSRVSRVREI